MSHPTAPRARLGRTLRTALRAGAAALALVGAPLALPAPALAQADGHVLSLQGADIRAFIDDVAMVTGYTLLVDPRVNGQVTVSSTDTLSDREVWEVFKSVLRNHGYTVTRTAPGTYRVTLLQGAVQDAPFVNTANGANQMGTTVIGLAEIDAAEAAKLVKLVLHTQGVVSANAGGRILVVTDFPENIAKAREIVGQMEAETSTVRVVALDNLSSIDAEEAMRQLVPATEQRVNIVGVPATNSVVLKGSPREIAVYERILSDLDRTTRNPRGAIAVVPIRYGDGEIIAGVVASLLPGLVTEGGPIPTVAFEPGSNTVIINAPGELQAELETIIRRLDQRRPQVLIEAMIVEISDTTARDLGVEFALADLDGNIPFIGTNFSRQAGDVFALTGAVATERLGVEGPIAEQLETAAVNSLFGLDGFTGIGLDAGGNTLFSVIVSAIQRDTESNILSTPFATTLDNVPTNLLVGQEIPIVTGESFGQGGALLNPFRTIERQEIGLQLTVLPQITEDGIIRLEIQNEVSSIAGVTGVGDGNFILNKRELQTTVLADSGEIIVLGGLIQDDEQVSVDKIPLLGDAPVIGPLFRSEGKSRNRTNLMVFLRPTILEEGQDARPLTQEYLDRARLADVRQSGRELSKIDTLVTSPTVEPTPGGARDFGPTTNPQAPLNPPATLPPIGAPENTTPDAVPPAAVPSRSRYRGQ